MINLIRYKEVVTVLTREQLLPDRIPAGLDAKRCYELGLRYRLAGHIGKAKEALSRACELHPASEYARKARTVLRTQLPSGNIPEKAEQRNIDAYNLMDSDPQAAKDIFLELMNQYPDFEWPFSNYAWMLVSEGDLKKARSLAKYLLSLNPHHLRSIHLSMQIALMEGKMDEALGFAERGEEASEGDSDFKELVHAIILHKKGEPPGVLPDGLAAREYLDLAKRYEMFGRLNLARSAVARAVELDGDGEVAARAGKFQRTHLPCVEIPAEAEERLIEACNVKPTHGRDQSRELLERLLVDFPQFENPAIVLASRFFQEKDLPRAEQYIKLALGMNPQSDSAKLFLMQLYMMQEQFEKAMQLIERDFTEPDQQTISLDLMKAQCELAIYQKQRNLHR